MTPSNIRLAKSLTYSGTLPFIIAVVIAFFSIKMINPFFLAQTYGAVIIAFLSGIHWALYLLSEKKIKINLLMTSNIFALSAWGALFISAGALALILEAVCFVGLYMLDVKLKQREFLPTWFYTLRLHATTIVVLNLFFLALLSKP